LLECDFSNANSGRIATFVLTAVCEVNLCFLPPEEKMWISDTGFVSLMPSCHPTNRVKALKDAESTDFNEEKYPLEVSSSVFIHCLTLGEEILLLLGCWCQNSIGLNSGCPVRTLEL